MRAEMDTAPGVEPGAEDSKRNQPGISVADSDRFGYASAVGSERHWCLFLYVKCSASENRLMKHIDVETQRPGWLALDELDRELVTLGMKRDDDWQVGTGAGYVAWVAPSEDAFDDLLALGGDPIG